MRVLQTIGGLFTKVSPFFQRSQPVSPSLPCSWVQQSDWILDNCTDRCMVSLDQSMYQPLRWHCTLSFLRCWIEQGISCGMLTLWETVHQWLEGFTFHKKLNGVETPSSILQTHIRLTMNKIETYFVKPIRMPVCLLFVVQLLGRVWLFVTLWTAAREAPLCFTLSQSLLKFMFFESVMLSNRPILCCSLLLRSTFPGIRVFSSQLFLSGVLETHLQKQSSNEYSGLISFRIDWFDLLAVQGTLKHFFPAQFKSTNSLALSFLHGPAHTSVHDYWKNHSFDYMKFYWQSDVSVF